MSISIRKTVVKPKNLVPGLNKDVLITFEGKSDTADVTIDFEISQTPDYVFVPAAQRKDYQFTNNYQPYTKTVDILKSNTEDIGLVELNATENNTGSQDYDSASVH